MAATMADVAVHTPSKPIPIRRLNTAQGQPQTTTAASASMGVMSPVNQDGCYEFDRIIKAGTVLKRTRRTRVGLVRASSDGC